MGSSDYWHFHVSVTPMVSVTIIATIPLPQPHRFSNLLEQLTEKHYTYDYNFIIKDTGQEQPSEERHRIRYGWGGAGFPFRLQGITLLAQQYAQTLLFQSFYMEFDCLRQG